jgi:hypothetical protein
MASKGFGAKRLSPSTLDQEPAIEALKQRFGVGGELVETYFHPYLYLNRKVIEAKGLDRREVEETLAAELMKFDGIFLALSSTALREGGVPNAPLVEQIRRNFHPKRSGDVYVVQEPYWFLYEAKTIPLCAIHGSPWRYDTFVPVIFAGAGLKGQRVARPVQPADIAPTLAARLGVKPIAVRLSLRRTHYLTCSRLGQRGSWILEVIQKRWAALISFLIGDSIYLGCKMFP